jgi:hypothetical protein
MLPLERDSGAQHDDDGKASGGLETVVQAECRTRCDAQYRGTSSTEPSRQHQPTIFRIQYAGSRRVRNSRRGIQMFMLFVQPVRSGAQASPITENGASRLFGTILKGSMADEIGLEHGHISLECEYGRRYANVGRDIQHDLQELGLGVMSCALRKGHATGRSLAI